MWVCLAYLVLSLICTWKAVAVLPGNVATTTENQNHLCKICKRQYGSRDSLLHHMIKIHGPERKYFCKKCLQGYDYRNRLIAHINKQHNKDPAVMEDALKRYPPEEKEIMCRAPHCFMMFESKGRMTEHYKKCHLSSTKETPQDTKEIPQDVHIQSSTTSLHSTSSATPAAAAPDNEAAQSVVVPSGTHVTAGCGHATFQEACDMCCANWGNRPDAYRDDTPGTSQSYGRPVMQWRGYRVKCDCTKFDPNCVLCVANNDNHQESQSGVIQEKPPKRRKVEAEALPATSGSGDLPTIPTADASSVAPWRYGDLQDSPTKRRQISELPATTGSRDLPIMPSPAEMSDKSSTTTATAEKNGEPEANVIWGHPQWMTRN